MKKQENIFHIKLERDEAAKSFRDILNTEIGLIKIAQSIKKYRALRLKELELKIQLYEQVKKFKSDEQRLRTILPKLQIPQILKKHESEIHKEKIMEEAAKIEEKKVEKTLKERAQKIKKEKEIKPQKPPVDDLEAQLKEIQERLRNLE